jgi:hypothetical protein
VDGETGSVKLLVIGPLCAGKTTVARCLRSGSDLAQIEELRQQRLFDHVIDAGRDPAVVAAALARLVNG